MIAWFLSNISAKYYKNLSMLSRVIAKNVGDVFLDTVYFVVCVRCHKKSSLSFSHLPMSFLLLALWCY